MKKLIVLSKHKFNTIDTVSPILLEYSKKTRNKIIIFFPYSNDLIQLKKNFVLYDTLKKISSIKLLGHKNYFFHKIIKIFYLFNLFFLALQKNKFIHFGGLEEWPFKIISIINKKNVFYCQSGSYFSDYERLRSLAYSLGVYTDAIKGKGWSNIKSITADNIIVNDERNYLQKHPKHQKKNFFIYKASRLSENWINNSQQYISEMYNRHKDANFNKGYIAFALGTFAPYEDLKNKDSQLTLFRETIEILKDLEIPTLIKPHYFTQMEIVHEELNKIKKENFFITYAHPTVLALNAKIWICNLFSSTCADAFGRGVPTIEYTDYSENLTKYTNNSSINSEHIDYFISRDKQKLKYTIRKILNEKKIHKQRIFPSDKSNLIDSLIKN